MKKTLLPQRKKAPRQEKILTEIDRLVCWKKLARCAEPCLEEGSQMALVKRSSLESLIRVAVLDRCFGIGPADIAAMPKKRGAQATPGQEELDRFFQMISRCSLRGRIMRELDAQLTKVGVSLSKQAINALL
ncbi:hypothetical protein PXK00_14830 [Phaeobacter sp. QD34_3]|uniref:hypothetical protein n=1 Tax=unclassified Phaeobacter TaxID=2621772 RepID=UPI00237EEDEC|nr:MULTISPECIES: hypothetical protein [unclassified Phaeobacter]MDE4134396.1 hypothetical protein [Phaeobacter sp. QD34_3]MDE4138726.1 hypothetical protein [Phaeobacter sp. QD34_24]MDE4175764.1 hypothetical protein [Phaeobacter sp. PT47_59]